VRRALPLLVAVIGAMPEAQEVESLSFLVPMPSRQADEWAAYSSAPWGGAEVVVGGIGSYLLLA
jgi:hypothetical protein